MNEMSKLWLESLTSQAARTVARRLERGRGGVGRAAFRRAVEALETRCLMSATTLTVTNMTDTHSDDQLNLREALAMASGGDFVIDVPSGTIDLSQGVLVADDSGYNLTIENTGGGVTTLDGQGQSTVLQVLAGANVTVSNITITGGQANQGYASASGGGIQNAGTLTLDDSVVSQNTAGQAGGGIANTMGTLTVDDSVIAGNTASGFGGGGIANNQGVVTVINSVITANTSAQRGAGLLNFGGTVTLTDTTVSGNTGIGIDSTSGSVTLDGTIVANSTGAADLSGSFVGSNDLIDDSTGSGLASLVSGPALLAPLGNYGGPTESMPPLPGSPALGNGATFAAADGVDQRGVTRSLTAPTIGAFESAGFVVTATGGTGIQSTDAGSAFNDLTVNVTANDPGVPVTGGVVTFTAPGSGASATLGAGTATVDGSGNASVSATANATVGAYSVTATAGPSPSTTASFSLTNTPVVVVVNNLTDSPVDGETDLRQAIAQANAAGAPAIIEFQAGLGGTIDLTSADSASTATGTGPSALVIANSVTIDGNDGGSGITINAVGQMRLFYVDPGVSLTLDDLTLSGGTARGGNGQNSIDGGGGGGGGGAGMGGAIFNAGTVSIVDSTFTQNSAVGGSGALSGGEGGISVSGGGGGAMDPTSPPSNIGDGAGLLGGIVGTPGFGDVPGGTGGAGGFGSGGGGGGGNNNNEEFDGPGGIGGTGGFGAGGGGGGSSGFGGIVFAPGGPGGIGGFGGGGGSGGSDGIGIGEQGPGGPGGFGGGSAFDEFFGPGFPSEAGGGAGMGGAIFNYGGTVSLSNSTFTANTATGGGGEFFFPFEEFDTGQGLGGAIFNYNGTLLSSSATISSNTANNGGRGIYSLADGASATAQVSNTIVGQSDTNESDFVSNSINGGTANTSGTGDLIRTAVGFSGTIVSQADPQLGPLANNDGPTQTLLPAPTSPVVDAADPTQIGSVVFDQRGDARVYGEGPDIGAVELGPTPPAFSSADTATFTTGVASSFTITTTGSPQPSMTELGALPAGLTFVDNGNGTATISGTPADDSGGTYSLSFTATNLVSPASQAFTLTVDQAPAISSANSSGAAFVADQPGTFAVTTTGFPTAALTESGTLPAGLSFVDNGDGTATISGTPDADPSGPYALTLNASNGIGSPATQAFTLDVNQQPAITSSASTVLTAGQAGGFTVTTSGFPAPALTETGALPPGMTFADNGDGTASLSGTPTAGGVYTLDLDAHNGFGSDATQPLNVTVDQAPSITSSAATTFTIGQPGTFTVNTAGFPAAALSQTGALPGGVTFVSNGDGTATISGTPAAATGGTYALNLTAGNGIGGNATQPFTLTITQPPAFTSSASSAFTLGQPDVFTVFTSGFPAPTITSTGTLPPGVTFIDNGNGSATLSGAALATGTYPLNLTAANGVGGSASQALTLIVGQPPAITTPAQESFQVGNSGTFVFRSTGYPAATLSETGALPSGVTFHNNGNGTATLLGTPAAGTAGVYDLTVNASNGFSPPASQAFVFTVLDVPTITSAANTQFPAGQSDSFTVTTGGYPVSELTQTGTLPAGVTFTDNGDGTATLAGTPTVAGVYPLTFGASNGVGADASQSFTLTVGTAPAITTSASTTFTVGQSGSFTIDTTGFPTASLSQTGALPNGLSFVDNGNGTATISGTPAVGSGGTYALALDASNGFTPDATQTLTLTVDEAPAITSSSTAIFTTGAAGSFTVTTGGFPAPAFTQSGALPAGLTFLDNGNGTATISGIPAPGAGGTYNLTLGAANNIGSSASQALTLTVLQAPHITSGGSATFLAGQAGSVTVTASGFSAVALTETGALPAGLTFQDNGNATATISGTPAPGSGGTYTVSIDAGNGVGSDDVEPFVITVHEAPSITSSSTATFTTGTAGSFTVNTFGFPVASLSKTGALPAGLSFVDNGNDTATISGTPSASTGGTYHLTLQAANGIGAAATQALTLTVLQGPAITSPANQTFTVGSAGLFFVRTTGFPTPAISLTQFLPSDVISPDDSGPINPDIPFSQHLPSGVNLVDRGNGTAILSGTPAPRTGGTYHVAIRAANGVGISALQLFTLTIDEAPSFTSNNAVTFVHGQSNSFTITTLGFPFPEISETGSLAGLSFVDNGNGTATLSGTPSVLDDGTYTFTLGASNDIGDDATQAFTLTIGGPPSITSAAATTFTVGQANAFTVSTAGFPVAALSQTGALPQGLSFVDNGNGTGTLSGTPTAGTGGTYALTIGAASSAGAAPSQSFTLTVDQAPAISSGASATFTAGAPASFTIQTSGFPVAAISETGALPSGLSFVDNGNGTATLAGTPAAGTGGVYDLTLTAANGVIPAATQSFALTVNQAPAITSADAATFTFGAAGSFTITTTGFPNAALGETGALPAGLTFVDNGDGTATISGTPASGTVGTYALTATASNDVSPDATQALTLTVNPAPLLITLTTPVLTYDGSPQPATSTTTPASIPVSYTYDASNTVPTDAGTYAVVASSADPDYAGTASGTLTIVQATPTLTLTTPVDAIYDAAPQGATADVTGVTGGVDPGAATLTYFAGTDTTGTLLPGAPTDAGTYTVQASYTGSTDYSAMTQTATYTIAPATPTVAINTPVGAVYDAAPQGATATVTGITGGVDPGPATLTYFAGTDTTGTPLPGAPTDAGTYTVLASYAGANDYTTASNTATYTIALATPTVSITAPNSAVYDALAQGATVNVIGVTGGADSGSATLTYFAGADTSGTQLRGAPIDAGTYTVQATYAGNSEYAPVTRTATYTISRAPLDLTVTPPIAAIYDGVAQGATVNVTGILSGETPATPTVTYFVGPDTAGTQLSGAPIGAGTYTVEATDSGNLDYLTTEQTATYTIGQAAASVSITPPVDAIYDATPHGATASVTGVFGGADPGTATLTYYAGPTASGAPLPGAPADAGTYTVQAVYAGSIDYAPASQVATYVIAPASPTVSIATPTGATYDTTAHGATVTVLGQTNGANPGTATLTYFAGPDASGTPLPGAPTNAGTYTVLATYAGTTDYSPVTQIATYTVAPARVTLDLITPTSAVYDGSPKTASTTVAGVPLGATPAAAQIQYFAGQTHNGTLLSGPPTEPGIYTALATHAAETNYAFVNEALAYIISPATPAVTITAANVPYTGSPRPVTTTVTGAANGAVPGPATLAYYAGTSAIGAPLPGAPSAVGTYTVAATYAGDAEYAPVIATAIYTIYGNPTVTPVSGTGLPGANIPLAPLSSAASVDGGALSVRVLTQPAFGSVSVVTVGGVQQLLYHPGPGAFTSDSFTYQVNDSFGGATTATATVNYSGIGVVSSYLNPGRQDLVVIEPSGNHTVTFANAGSATRVKVTLDGAAQGTYAVTGRVFGFAPTGNDTFNGSATSAPLWFYGGTGNNTFIGGAGGDVLIGGPGNDYLNGGGGRNLLIGGGGTDTLVGSKGSNILVAGTTIYDAPTLANQSALLQILTAWQTTHKMPTIPSGVGAAHGGAETPALDDATVASSGTGDVLLGNTKSWFFGDFTFNGGTDVFNDGRHIKTGGVLTPLKNELVTEI